MKPGSGIAVLGIWFGIGIVSFNIQDATIGVMSFFALLATCAVAASEKKQEG